MKKTILFILLISLQVKLFSQEDSLEIKYNYINSIPQNAEVFVNGEYKGNTPCRFPADVKINSYLIKKDGYKDEVRIFSVDNESIRQTFVLIKKNNLADEKLVLSNSPFTFKPKRKIIPIILSSLITAGSIGLSFYFKDKANTHNELYAFSGDQRELDKVKKFDLYSGISLGVFQVSFIGLIYFLMVD